MSRAIGRQTAQSKGCFYNAMSTPTARPTKQCKHFQEKRRPSVAGSKGQHVVQPMAMSKKLQQPCCGIMLNQRTDATTHEYTDWKANGSIQPLCRGVGSNTTTKPGIHSTTMAASGFNPWETLAEDFFKPIYSVLPAIPDALLLLALRAQLGRPAENAQHRHRMHEPLEVRHSLLERGRFVRQAQHLGSGHRPRGYTRAPTWLNFCSEPVDSRPHVPCGLEAKFPMSILMSSTLAAINHKFHSCCLLRCCVQMKKGN